MSDPNPHADSTPPPDVGNPAGKAGISHTEDTTPAADAAHPPADAVGLELVKLLADGPSADFVSDGVAAAPDAPVYDGHVALALDPGLLPDMDSTLDLLTSSHQLFDVPALDAASVIDDSLPT